MVTTGMAVAGRVLGGRYALGPALGVGASATVHEAIDTTLGRRVAVKVLHAALAADEAFLQRFRSEARSAAALSHPNILRVYDWGEDSETGPWLVSELMTGGSLRDLLDRGHRLSVAQARRVGVEAASGLEHAHRRGLVHRDIKPANLLFDEEGRVVIADFGLARALAEAAVTEPSGTILGTAKYAAPEQARGQSVDGRADVYSLALVLIEAVTGRVPFAADTTIATLMARVGNDLHPPSQMGPLVNGLARAGRALPDSRSDAGRLTSDLTAVAGEAGVAERLPVTGAGTLPRLRTVPEEDRTEHGPTDRVAAVSTRRRPKRRRARRAFRYLWVPIVVALIATGIVASGALVPTREVPLVTGGSLSEARAELAAAGLEAEVSLQIFDDDTVEGQVLGQMPGEGETRKANRPVELTVSKGPTPVPVPDLALKTQEEATAGLTEIGLVVGSVSEEFNVNTKGLVINWAPREAEAPKGSAVNLTLSKGPPPVPIPEGLAGLTFAEVSQRLTALGLEPVRERVFSDDVEVGAVVGTSPAAGEQAPHGSQVKVRESQGPELVSVPDVRGDDIDEATDRLESAGLKVGEVVGRGRRDRVAGTDPEPGTQVRKGTSVDLFVV